jgi:hypothetical protein
MFPFAAQKSGSSAYRLHSTINNSILGYHLEFETETLWKLENKEQSCSGSLGTPCHNAWVGDSHKR